MQSGGGKGRAGEKRGEKERKGKGKGGKGSVHVFIMCLVSYRNNENLVKPEFATYMWGL
jgi:hypothetical protein